MFLSSKNLSDKVCRLKALPSLTVHPTKILFQDDEPVRKRNISIVPAKSKKSEEGPKKKLEVLFDGYYYDVTEFMERHPGGDIIGLYTDTKEDATIAIQQFHYRSLKTVMAKIKGLQRRPATSEDIGLDGETKKRHDELTKDFFALSAEMEAEGLMDPAPRWMAVRFVQSLAVFACGLALKFCLGHLFIWWALSLIMITLAGGQLLWLGHEGGHNSCTGNPKVDRVLQVFSYGFAFGLSASCWNSTHSEHHAMPQHETKDSDLKTMPLIAFNKRLVRDAKHKSNKWLHYQHLLFVLCDTLIVTLTWKLNHHLQFVIKHKCWLDLVCMICHYSLVPMLGFTDWLIITWLSSIYVLGNLILSHTHFPVVEEGTKLHWVEYAFHYTTNVKSSTFGWVDVWMGNLNYQIEHHLFPTMPEYKGRFCRDKVKAFAKRHNLPYRLCSYWEAVNTAYCNLENVANEIRHL